MEIYYLLGAVLGVVVVVAYVPYSKCKLASHVSVVLLLVSEIKNVLPDDKHTPHPTLTI